MHKISSSYSLIFFEIIYVLFKTMIDYKNDKINNIPELKIGYEKLLSKFKLDIKFKNIKDWFLGFTIRW